MTDLVSAGYFGQVNQNALAPSISADGRFVTFFTSADNLVLADANGQFDVFLFDRVTQQMELVSQGGAGLGNGGSTDSAVSADGRFVAFASQASNLVAGDTNGLQDIFVRDRLTGAMERVSIGSLGEQSTHASELVGLSNDGRYVLFASATAVFDPADTNGQVDLYRHDRTTGETVRVSLGAGAAQIAGATSIGQMSSDGRYVVFLSNSDLLAADTNGTTDVYRRDLESGAIELVSIGLGGASADGGAFMGGPSISADGRYVSFNSMATNLVAGDVNAQADIFVRDMVLGTTQMVSLSTAGVQSDNFSFSSQISGDGRYVAFVSSGTTLVTGDTNGTTDVFVRDTLLGTTIRGSVDSAGGQGNLISGGSTIIDISDTGRVVFASAATNLVSGDLNGVDDVFVSSDFRFNSADNIVTLHSGGERVSGLAGSDTITGGAGIDVIYGAAGSDILRGGDNNDTLFGQDDLDELRGDAGNDVLNGGLGNDTLDGGTGDDTLYGYIGDDTLIGNTGADRMNGGDGLDLLRGGAGRDVMTGGAQADKFDFDSKTDSVTTAGQRDVIADFVRAQGDKIDLSTIDARTTAAGNQSFTFIGSAAFSGKAGQLHFRVEAGNAIVEGDLNGDRKADFAIEVRGLTSLLSGDFVL